MGYCTEDKYQEFLRSCPEFERMLMRAGIILIKYWFSVSDEEQEQRFRSRIEDPTKRWKISPMDVQSRSHWVEYSKAKDAMFAYTDIKQAPWFVVNSNDKKRARLNVITHLLNQIPYEDTTPEKIELPAAAARRRLCSAAHHRSDLCPGSILMSILAQVDLTLALPAEAYAEQLPAKQAAVSLLMRQILAQKRPVVIVFEGSDPAGQGDTIKRLTEKLEPRLHVVYRNAPPEGEDKVRPYLYRFWRRLPGRGYAAIFDGSWYERVLAERVDGQRTPAEWRPLLPELDQFERQLTDFGAIVVKFWLHVGADEQARRANASDTPVWSAARCQALRKRRRRCSSRPVHSVRPGPSWRPTTRRGPRSGCWM